MHQYYKQPVRSQETSKVPEVTLGFWIIKILATTLGETGGDAVTMSMNLGYLAGTAIFAAIFAAAVTAQMSAKRFHPLKRWSSARYRATRRGMAEELSCLRRHRR